MTRRLFFSWQADTPNNTNRSFIRAALEAVCKQTSTDASLDEAAREITVDSDTQGVAGQPPIAETILNKIDAAAVVIADMTFTGIRLDGRPTPNPNVLLEYGWALKSLGHNRVITVMNTAYGEPSADNLPFDLAHLRWPLRYNLSADADMPAKAEEKRRFVRELKDAVQASLALAPLPATAVPLEYRGAVSKDGPARFRAADEALGYKEDAIGDGGSEVFLALGPAMWLRLMPLVDPQRRWTIKELSRCSKGEATLFPLLDRTGSYSHVRASDGQGMYYILAANDRQRIITDTVAFAFRTGEIWSVDVGFLTVDPKRLFYSKLQEIFVTATERYRRFLSCLGIDGPLRWSAGLVGVKGRRLAFPPPPGHTWAGYGGPICAADHLESTGILNNEQKAFEALSPFFEVLFEESGVERPEYLARQ